MPLFSEIIANFADKRILVVGDIILDQYIWGNVDRVSPEAPVPVVVVAEETYRLGGAANAAANICSLGAKVSLISVIGSDKNGDILSQKLLDMGADVKSIIRDDSRSTIVKTRVIAHHQHVVRIDREVKDEIKGDVREKVIAYAKKAIPDVDAVLISDYDKGVISKPVLEAVISCGREYGKLVVIDPKMRNFWSYTGATAVTPNLKEACTAVNMTVESEEDIINIGNRILRDLNLQALLITRGENGMTLFQGDAGAMHIPAVAREVFDVTGAGDTVIAVFTLSLAAGADFALAAKISNYAAGIVVGHIGTGCVKPDELLAVVR